MLDSKSFEEKSPEWALAKFLEAWKARNWVNMLQFCQISWRRIQPDGKKAISMKFRHKLIDAEILEVKKIADVTRDIYLKLKVKEVNRIKTWRRRARVICEKGYMKPSVEGTWGVNPTSVKRAIE